MHRIAWSRSSTIMASRSASSYGSLRLPVSLPKRWISALLYLMQGWAVVVCIPALWTLLDPIGFWLLVVGGICYTIGAVFYTCTKKKKYMHSVFHLWVLAGSIFQFFSIYLFVLA